MDDQITATHLFAAPRERVFSAWLSPRSLVPPVSEIEVDARIGGSIRLSAPRGDAASTMTGWFLCVEPPQRLEYTWAWEGDPECTIVGVCFRAAGERTLVEVRHRGFRSQASSETHRTGWAAYFAGLDRFL